MITSDDCKAQLDKYGLETPDDIMMAMYLERVSAYALTYSDATNKALRVLVVCYLVLSSGVRELQARGASGASQSFKQKDALKHLKKLISNLDENFLIDDLPSTSISSSLLVGVGGYV